MQDKIQAIIARVQAVNEELRQLRPEFVAFITDKSIPLTERWDTWESAPSELKDHHGWIVHFESLPRDFVGYDCDVNADRHQTVNISNIMENLYEKQQMVEDGEPEKGNWMHKYWKGAVEFFEKHSIEEFQEEVLAMNLESFEYDW
jgi:hypothetical protein